MASLYQLNAVARGFPPSGGSVSYARQRMQPIPAAANSATLRVLAVLHNAASVGDITFTPETDIALVGAGMLFFNVLQTPEIASLRESFAQEKGRDGSIAVLGLPGSGTWLAGDQWRAEIADPQTDITPGDVIVLRYLQGAVGQALPAGLLALTLQDATAQLIRTQGSGYNGVRGVGITRARGYV